MSDFATPWTVCGLPGSSVQGISQARILEWIAISFSRGSSRPQEQTRASCLAGRFFTTEPPRKPLSPLLVFKKKKKKRYKSKEHSLKEKMVYKYLQMIDSSLPNLPPPLSQPHVNSILILVPDLFLWILIGFKLLEAMAFLLNFVTLYT